VTSAASWPVTEEGGAFGNTFGLSRETSFSDTPDVTFTAAPLAIKDKLIVGAANGDQGVRDWIAGLDAATGKLGCLAGIAPTSAA
jgi:hypothetical protein